MMDDIADQQDLANEISNAISNPVGFGQDMDEDELEKELEALETEALEEELVKVPKPHELPAVPTEEVAKPKASKTLFAFFVSQCIYVFNVLEKVEDDDEMKELENWAS